MIIECFVETDNDGSRCEFDIEVDDGLTDEEISQIAQEAAFEHVTWGWIKDGEVMQ